MSAFEFFCQYCGQRLAASPKDIGRKVECPVCESRFPIPRPSAKPSESAPVEVTAAVDDEAEEEPAPDWSGRQAAADGGSAASAPSPEGNPPAPAADAPAPAADASWPRAQPGAGEPQPVHGPSPARETQPGVLEFGCPFCSQSLAATVADVGVAAVCPVCDTEMSVPPAGEVAQHSGGAVAEPVAGEGNVAAHESDSLSDMPNSDSTWDTVSMSDSSLDLGTEVAAGDMFGGAVDAFGTDESANSDFRAFVDDEIEPVDVPVEAIESDAEHVPVAPLAAPAPGDVPELVDLPEPLPLDEADAAAMAEPFVAGPSVPVIRAFKPPADSDPAIGRANEEILTDGAAGVIRAEAMKTLEQVLPRTRALCGIVEPEFAVKPVVAPRFYAFTRTSPTGTRNLWLFVFFRMHMIAFEPGTRTEVICRSPDFSFDVVFRPGSGEANAQTLFGLRLSLLGAAAKQAVMPKDDDGEAVSVAPGEKVEPHEVCRVKLSMRSAGSAAQAAQEVALKLKSWIQEHPVLSKQVEKRVKKRKAASGRSSSSGAGSSGPRGGAPPERSRVAPTPQRRGAAASSRSGSTARMRPSRPTGGAAPTKRGNTGAGTPTSERTNKPKLPSRTRTGRLKKRK